MFWFPRGPWRWVTWGGWEATDTHVKTDTRSDTQVGQGKGDTAMPHLCTHPTHLSAMGWSSEYVCIASPPPTRYHSTCLEQEAELPLHLTHLFKQLVLEKSLLGTLKASLGFLFGLEGPSLSRPIIPEVSHRRVRVQVL